jgi:gamma-tubulin complex component 3
LISSAGAAGAAAAAAAAVIPGDGETGWDVFSLHYQLGPPLSSIFTPDAQKCYSQLSRLLWLMRRTERSLGTGWHTLKVRLQL